jgi:hypothetical protein
MAKNIKEKKIDKIYYWNDNANNNSIKIQICYNNNFAEIINGNLNILKELEQQTGIKAKKI